MGKGYEGERRMGSGRKGSREEDRREEARVRRMGWEGGGEKDEEDKVRKNWEGEEKRGGWGRERTKAGEDADGGQLG